MDEGHDKRPSRQHHEGRRKDPVLGEEERCVDMLEASRARWGADVYLTSLTDRMIVFTGNVSILETREEAVNAFSGKDLVRSFAATYLRRLTSYRPFDSRSGESFGLLESLPIACRLKSTASCVVFMSTPRTAASEPRHVGLLAIQRLRSPIF